MLYISVSSISSPIPQTNSPHHPNFNPCFLTINSLFHPNQHLQYRHFLRPITKFSKLITIIIKTIFYFLLPIYLLLKQQIRLISSHFPNIHFLKFLNPHSFLFNKNLFNCFLNLNLKDNKVN